MASPGTLQLFMCYSWHVIVLFLHVIFRLIRRIVWLVNGTDTQLSRNRGTYKKSLQVLDIWARHKLDAIAFGNFLSDFFLVHESFRHPNHVLRSEVSLYCITPREFVFVECAEGECAWDLRDYAFSREGQFRKAKKVLILPTKSAHRLAKELENRPREKLIILHNTARCGSTLLCQAFQSTGKCISYTEPFVSHCLLELLATADDVTSAQLVRTTLSLLCPPLNSRKVEAHVLKVQPFCGEIMKYIASYLPGGSINIFMYRDVKSICVSQVKALMELPGTNLLGIAEKTSLRWMTYLALTHGIKTPKKPIFSEIELRPKAKMAQVALWSLQAMRQYLDLRESGIKVHAVRYEDFVARPSEMLSAIFSICGLDSALTGDASQVLGQDSQERSSISRKKLRNIIPPEYTELDERDIREICRELNLPDVTKEFRLSGTIDT